MRRTQALGALAGALLVCLATPAAGVERSPPTLELEPAKGTTGDMVLVSGGGWVSGKEEPVRLYADVADVGTGQPLVQQDPTVDGNITVPFRLPELEPGEYTFYACQRCETDPDGVLTARRAFEVVQPERTTALVLDRESARPGEQVTVSGEDWSAALGPATLTLTRTSDGVVTPLPEAPVPDRLSGIFVVAVTVPQVAEGDYVLGGCQACEEPESRLEAAAALAVTAATVRPVQPAVVNVDPPAGRPGQRVEVVGRGWSPEEPVLLFAAEALRSDPADALATAAVSPEGLFRIDLTVPWDAPGAHRLYACQGCAETPPSRSDSTGFVVSPLDRTIAVSPRAGPPGETVLVSGVGWTPVDGDVSLYADRSLAGDPGSRLLTTTPGERGRVVGVPLEVPDLEPGSHQWYACQRCDDPDGPPGVTVGFTVRPGPAPALQPELRVAPTSGEAGDTVRASGTGWSAERGEVRVFADQAHVADPTRVLASAVVDADGGFTTELELVVGTATEQVELFACQDCGAPEGFPAATASFQVDPESGTDARLLLLAAAAALVVTAAAAQRWARRVRSRSTAPPTGRPSLRAGADDGFRVVPDDHDAGERPSIRLVPHDAPLAVLDPPEDTP